MLSNLKVCDEYSLVGYLYLLFIYLFVYLFIGFVLVIPPILLAFNTLWNSKVKKEVVIHDIFATANVIKALWSSDEYVFLTTC